MNIQLALLIRLSVLFYFTGFSLLTIWSGNAVTNFCLHKLSMGDQSAVQAGFVFAGLGLMLSAFLFLRMKGLILQILSVVPFLQGFSFFYIQSEGVSAFLNALLHFIVAFWFFVLGRFLRKTYQYKWQTLTILQYSLGFLFISFAALSFILDQQGLSYIQNYLQALLNVSQFHSSSAKVLVSFFGILNLAAGLTMFFKPRVLTLSYMVFFGGIVASSKLIMGEYHGKPEILLRSLFFLMPVIYYAISRLTVEKKFFIKNKGH